MERFKFINKNQMSKLPKNPGVYLFKKGKDILYIGKAINIKERVKNHFSQPNFRDNLFINEVKKIGYIVTNSEIEALILEANLIKKYRPKYNIVWKDDKNYFYVVVTKEDYPQIYIAHQINQRGNFIGPFVDGGALRETLKFLRKVFPYRSCKNFPKRPCLWYQLNKCPAPCLIKSKIKQELPSFEKEMRKECKKNAKNILNILRGEKFQVIKELKKEMEKYSVEKNFEKAAEIRDRISSLEKTFSHAKIFGQPDIFLKEKIEWEKLKEKLRSIFSIKEDISRIEGYDISNIQGKLATGSMVVFNKGRADKKSYRLFKIKTVEKPNDVAMIKEVLSRRLKHTEWELPQLILIDGGVAQLNAALKAKKEKDIKVISLAKKENKLFVEKLKNHVLLKNLPKEVFNLILRIRDESHRFARKYHHKLREKNLLE